MKKAERGPRLLSDLVYWYADLAYQLDPDGEKSATELVEPLFSPAFRSKLERLVIKQILMTREIAAINNEGGEDDNTTGN